MRASSALRTTPAEPGAEPPVGAEEIPALASELVSALSPKRTKPLFQGPHDTTRVLLAEEDPLDRRIVRVVLSNPRVSLIEVTTGQAVLDLLALKRFDLVILGGMGSVMTAQETVRWIRGSLQPWSDIAILMLLAPQDMHACGRLMTTGATACARKPVSREELAEKLVSLMPGLSGAGL